MVAHTFEQNQVENDIKDLIKFAQASGDKKTKRPRAGTIKE